MILSPMCMLSLTAIGCEIKKALVDRISDNPKKKNNVRGHWRPVSGFN